MRPRPCNTLFNIRSTNTKLIISTNTLVGIRSQIASVQVDLCEPNPCPESSYCVNHGNNYSCECPKGFSGPDCLMPSRAVSFSFSALCKHKLFFLRVYGNLGRNKGGGETLAAQKAKHKPSFLRVTIFVKFHYRS